MKSALLVAFLIFSPQVFAQESISVGTALPVRLETSLSKKTTPGQLLKARVMQDVPLANGSKIPAGAKVLGEVLKVTPKNGAMNAEISLKFDRVVTSRRTFSVSTDLRALASLPEVDDAQLPDTGPDRGTPPSAYTTVQVGGDEVVYRGGGHVMDASEVVGEPVPGGILARLRPNFIRGCRGPLAGNEPPQALWVFASNACGVYGYGDIEISNSGRNASVGRIVLESARGHVTIPGGSGMLLRVVGNQSHLQELRGL